jgi:cytochrome c-type biogenesis protein CcmF
MGTFLVRSGVLNSIHAFGGATLGVPFVVLIAVLVGGSIHLVVSRRELLRSEHRLDSLLSRESVFMANNLVLVGLCFVIFWGTYFPLISEALTGQTASVGPPWFDRYTVPLALVLVLLAGVGPVISWRRATLANARRNFLVPLACALIALFALLLAGPASTFTGHRGALIMFCCAAFVLGSVGQELWRGTRARMASSRAPAPVAAVALVQRNRRRYGGYVVHAGIALLFVGVAASSSFQHVSELGLSPGQSTRVGTYTIRYVRPTASVSPAYTERRPQSERLLRELLRAQGAGVALAHDPAHTGAALSLGAVLAVYRHGHRVATLAPSEGFYDSGDPTQGSVGHFLGGQGVSHVSMSASLTRDVWSAVAPVISTPALQRIVDAGNRTIPLVRPDEGILAVATLAGAYMRDPPPAQFRLIVSPLVMWIWIGGLIVFGGGLIAIWPAPSAMRRRVAARSRARAGRALARA